MLTTHNGFRINAKKVIIAQGFESRKYIDKRIAFMTRSFTLVTKPVSSFEGWYNRCIIRDTNKSYTYLRSTEDNRIIVGGEDIDMGGENSKASDMTNDDLSSIEKFNILEQKLRSLFHGLKDIEIEYKFSGLFGETKDGLPYIGEYQPYPNCWFCLGYGSNGILYSILGGQMLRDLYVGTSNSDINLFSFYR